VKNKKVTIAIISVIALVLVIIGITYAYWLVTETQERENIITTGCLDITLNGEANEIKLQNQFPMTDEDGLNLIPYEFTITNNCNTEVDYQINLESFDTADLEEISKNALKVAIYKKGTEASSVTPALLSSYQETDTMIDGAISANKLLIDTLGSRGSATATQSYNLLIWIDKDAPISEMEKGFSSKISVTVGQGIYNPLKEGTLAYKIVENNSGINGVEEIETEFQHLILWETERYLGPSTYTFGTSYTYDQDTNKYSLSGTTTTATLEQCRNKTKICGKYLLDWNSLYEITDFRTSSDGYYVTANYISYTNRIANPDDTKTFYKTQDDLGTSYYFHGNTENNYVKFGTLQEDDIYYEYYNDDWTGDVFSTLGACQEYAKNYQGDCREVNISAGADMYWRIVRINGDGTIRMFFDGYNKRHNDEYTDFYGVGYTQYNSSATDIKHVGYTYDDGNGTQVDSTIKTVLDNWYEKHLKNNYGKYIADGIFCNDRQTAEVTDSYTDFAGSQRKDASQPTLTCTNKNDRYTMNAQNGNGLLKNPVGLLTVDELLLAGADYYDNNRIYVSGAYDQWTMSPSGYDSYGAHNFMLYYGNLSNYLYYSGYTTEFAEVLPVINLKADVEFTGNGSYETPYEIVIE